VTPSGQQFEIRHGDHRATIVEVGGGLRTYSVGARDVVDGYDVGHQCDGARGQTLVPWPNRVRDGSWTHEGQTLQLALTEPAQHNAIHGLLRWVPWSLTERSASAVTLSVRVFPQPGYPWLLDVSNAWTLGAEGLAVTTTIANASDTPAPVAAGFHPYLTAGTPTVDDAVLTLPASTRLLTGAQQIPTGAEPVAGTAYDFSEPRRIGDLQVDYAFTDLQRDPDGRARLRLTDSAGGGGVTLWVDEAYPYLEVFTGDSLPDPTRRRQGLGVEPMSAPPNALATGDMVMLSPGDVWRGSWGIEPQERA
jgi:aldose 1-epimerase